jgi:PAS domain S-box-containing protein
MDLHKFVEWFKRKDERVLSSGQNQSDIIVLDNNKPIDLKDPTAIVSLQIELMGQLNALHNAAIVSETDLQGNIIFANDRFCELSKYSWDELVGSNHRILKSGHQPDELFQDLWDTITKGNTWKGIIKNKAKDGSFYWVDSTITPVLDPDTRKPVKYVAIRFDITTLKTYEQELQQMVEEIGAHEEELSQTIEEIQSINEELTSTQIELRGQVAALNNAAIVSETDLLGNITYVNDLFCKFSKYSPEELMGNNHRILKSGHQPDSLFVEMWETICSGRYFQGEIKNRAKDGSYYWVVATITPVMGEDNKPIKYISVRYPITNQKELEEQLYDELKKSRLLRDELEAAKIYLEQRVIEQQGELHDSVVYAERIQRALMPTHDVLSELIPKQFEIDILFMPRDRISGDFFWVGKWKKKTILAIGDGTGHGVPGAFMSIFGITALIKLVEERGMVDPASILDELDDNIRRILRQEEGFDTIQDSIEMNILALSDDTSQVHISSAMRKAIIARGGELIEVETDRRPVGGTLYGHEPFTTHQLELQPSDVLYLFSDGYVSQLGGDTKPLKKFGIKAFKDLIKSIPTNMTLKQQMNVFRQNLLAWKGDFNDQTDDVIIVALRYLS